MEQAARLRVELGYGDGFGRRPVTLRHAFRMCWAEWTPEAVAVAVHAVEHAQEYPLCDARGVCRGIIRCAGFEDISEEELSVMQCDMSWIANFIRSEGGDR